MVKGSAAVERIKVFGFGAISKDFSDEMSPEYKLDNTLNL